MVSAFQVVMHDTCQLPNRAPKFVLLPFSSPDTDNALYEEGDASYQNVAVVHDICVPNVELLRTLATAVQPGSAEGDFLDAGKADEALQFVSATHNMVLSWQRFSFSLCG